MLGLGMLCVALSLVAELGEAGDVARPLEGPKCRSKRHDIFERVGCPDVSWC